MPAAVMGHAPSSLRLKGYEEKAQSIFDLYDEKLQGDFQKSQ
jgi:hypothetical protein